MTKKQVDGRDSQKTILFCLARPPYRLLVFGDGVIADSTEDSIRLLS